VRLAKYIGVLSGALIAGLAQPARAQPAPAQPAAKADVISWVQYVAVGLEARAITDQAACPTAAIDGKPAAMIVRAAPAAGFSNTVCALALPFGTSSVSLDGTALPLPSQMPKRIAVIGDTGCRLKGIYIQACNDPAQWPFRQIATVIAAQKPDLIIHVGDYHYRESPCPKGDAGCEGSPFGDTWNVWREDFFAPAAALLGAAPWVMVRGNHETCDRGGQGWSRTLEAAAFDARGCNGPSPTFAVSLPQMTLAVVDTSEASEPVANAAQAAAFRGEYSALAKDKSPVWLLQHRPIWSTGGMVAGLPFGDNKTLALAARDVMPEQVQLSLSGHHHVFQVLSYVENLPAQIVVGHGGDYLNKGRSGDPAGWVINGVTVRSGVHQTGKFGFAMLEPSASKAGSWQITNYDQTGKPLQRCDVAGRTATCSGE
jgi:Calcineurin-like phosphoesterase